MGGVDLNFGVFVQNETRSETFIFENCFHLIDISVANASLHVQYLLMTSGTIITNIGLNIWTQTQDVVNARKL